MDLSLATQILIIILAVTLTVFLIIGIVFLVKLLSTVNKVKRGSEMAQSMVQDADNVVRKVRTIVTPSVIIKLVATLIGQFTGRDVSSDTTDKSSKKGGKK